MTRESDAYRNLYLARAMSRPVDQIRELERVWREAWEEEDRALVRAERRWRRQWRAKQAKQAAQPAEMTEDEAMADLPWHEGTEATR